jgi:hypothetical protein
MDHAEAIELLELAAVESGGLDRLTAGDTPQAAAVAGHMAACPDCPELLERLRREAPVLRQVVRSTLPPDLRERTLAYVAELGRLRAAGGGPGAAPLAAESSGAASAATTVGPAAPERSVVTPWPGPASAAPARGGRGRWLTGIAAGLIVLVAVAGLVLNLQTRADLDRQAADINRQAAEINGLSRIASRSLEIGAQADADRIALAGTGDRAGTILYSSAAMELVILAEGIEPPPAGKEFRCWAELDGRRVMIGKMFFGGDLSYWAGGVDADLSQASRFGVTLVDASGASVDGEPVLSGER